VCESIAYIREGNSEKLYARDIATLVIEENKIVLIDIAGNTYTLKGSVLGCVGFVGHIIILRKTD